MSGNQQSTVEVTGTAPNTASNTSTETPMSTNTNTRIADVATGDVTEATVRQTAQYRSTLPSERETEEESETESEEQHSGSIHELPTTCDECGSESLTHSTKRAEISCSDCGSIVQETMFPQSANWKRESAVEHQTETSVTGNDDAGINMSPLGGTIDWKDMDGYGRSLSSKKRSRMHRLRQRDRKASTESHEESNYKYALSEINRLAADLEVPRHVRDAASELYQDAIAQDALSGLSIEAAATITLHIACVEENAPRDLDEVSEISRAEVDELVDTYDAFAQDIGAYDYGSPVTAYVPMIAEELGVDTDDSIRDITASILEGVVTEDVFSEGALREHTAAAMYTACLRSGAGISQARVADAASVAVDALRDRYQQHLETVVLN